MKHTDAFKEQKRIQMTGNKHSLGVRASDETREKLSAARMGNKNAAGSRRTAEEKENLRQLMKGNTRSLGVPISGVRKVQVSAFMKGHKYGVGRPQSLETRAKRSEALRAAWAARLAGKPISRKRRKRLLLREKAGQCQASQ
jgi:DUF971 family protein